MKIDNEHFCIGCGIQLFCSKARIICDSCWKGKPPESKYKPFHEETTNTYEVEMYNAEDIAEKGETAIKKSFSLPEVYNLVDIKNRAIALKFDTFEITETQYTTKIYSVE